MSKIFPFIWPNIRWWFFWAMDSGNKPSFYDNGSLDCGTCLTVIFELHNNLCSMMSWYYCIFALLLRVSELLCFWRHFAFPFCGQFLIVPASWYGLYGTHYGFWYDSSDVFVSVDMWKPFARRTLQGLQSLIRSSVLMHVSYISSF